jgi:AsmA-like protein
VVTGDVRADGLELIGEARMDDAGMFQSANIERIFSRDNVDLRGLITRRSDGGYKVAVSGPFFDASPWMDSLLSMSGDKSTTDIHGEPLGVGGPEEPGPAFDLQLTADKLRLRENAELTGAKIAMLVDADGPRNGTVTGQIGKDKQLNVTINTEADVRKVSIKSDDAGFGARVLLKTDYLIGGKLTLDGSFEGKTGTAMVTMTDVRLKDAPFVAQLFSLASLRGLADVLSGEGVLFTSVEAPVKLQNGRIDLPGLRASGPAMGITARGWIAPAESELSLDGVLVPSFGVNSLLGGLPIIGDLFVSRQGEGMFAPTYSVRGTFSKARVAINPVAAFTPGVLRRIFENPAEPPPVADAAPVTPPAAAQN